MAKKIKREFVRLIIDARKTARLKRPRLLQLLLESRKGNSRMAHETQHIASCMQGVIAAQCAAMGLSEERMQQFFDPAREPDPMPCPHCGRPLHYHLLVPENPSWGWCPIPEPCQDPQCAEKAEAERAKEQRRSQAAKLLRDIREAGIPRLYERCTSATFETPSASLHRALKAVRTWTLDIGEALQTGRGLYICGPVGAGKTHLAVIAARGALCQSHYVRFLTSTDLVCRLRSASGYDPLSEYRNCSLLVLDGVGAEIDQRWVLTRIYDLIAARHASRRPTVYTSRCDRSDLQHYLTPAGADMAKAFVSLIGETSQVVEVLAADYLAQKGARP